MVGNVESLLQRINDIGIVQRMLSWKQVRSLGGLAAQEFGELRARADAADRRAADVEQRLRLQEDTIRRSGEDVLQARTDAQRISLQMENVSAALRQTEQSLAAAKAKAEADYLEIRRLNADMITAQGNEERARTQAGDAAKKAYEMSASLEAEKIERMREVAELHLRLSHLQQEAESLSSELNASKALLAAEDAVREDRLVKYQEGVAQLNALKQTQDSALREMKETAVREAEQRLHAMKETWARHEQNVEAHLKAVCRVLDLDYVDREKVPFNGKPDNTVTVCEQFVIFDAKSPEGEDLQNFPTYVKDQAEKAKKYLADGVMRGDIPRRPEQHPTVVERDDVQFHRPPRLRHLPRLVGTYPQDAAEDRRVPLRRRHVSRGPRGYLPRAREVQSHAEAPRADRRLVLLQGHRGHPRMRIIARGGERTCVGFREGGEAEPRHRAEEEGHSSQDVGKGRQADGGRRRRAGDRYGSGTRGGAAAAAEEDAVMRRKGSAL